jgi:hypothetical protein
MSAPTPATATATVSIVEKYAANCVSDPTTTPKTFIFEFLGKDGSLWRNTINNWDGYTPLSEELWWRNAVCTFFPSATNYSQFIELSIRVLYPFDFGSYNYLSSDLALVRSCLPTMSKLLRLADTSPEVFEFLMALLKKTTGPEKTEYDIYTRHIINLVGILKFVNEIMKRFPSEDWSKNDLWVPNLEPFSKFEQLFESRRVSEFYYGHKCEFDVISSFGGAENIPVCLPKLDSRFIWVAAFCHKIFHQSFDVTPLLVSRLQQFAEYCWAEITRVKGAVEEELNAKATFDFLGNAEIQMNMWLDTLNPSE